jgi:hypothetical protein
MTLIERLRADADICQAISRVDPMAMLQSANALRHAARALEAADAMAQAMLDVDNAFSRREHINAALNAADVAVKAYRAATKGEG